MRAATGKVKTHAAAMLRMVDHCSPLLLAIMVPATPEESTCVVLTGRPYIIRCKNGAHRNHFGRGALGIRQVGFPDLLAYGYHNALPADHGAQPKRDRHRHLDPGGMNLVARSSFFL